MLLRLFFLKWSPKNVWWFGYKIARSYYTWRLRQLDRVREWHYDELMRCDPIFRSRELQFELNRRRIAALGQGIGPHDPRYPSERDVYPPELMK